MSENLVYFTANSSPKMIEAFKEAQNTFKYFWRELFWEYRRIVPSLSIAFVKIAFIQKTQNDEIIEHMWIDNVHFDGNNITGVLLNSPNKITNINNGDTINVPFNQISDWLIANNVDTIPKTYGGFTIQAIRSSMSENERFEHDNAWGLDFGDSNEVLYVIDQKIKPENLIEHPMSINMREKLNQFLIENPNEISVKDENGLTLLHKETIAGNATSVEVLLKFGADKNHKSNQGETSIDLAKKMQWQHIIAIFENNHYE